MKCVGHQRVPVVQGVELGRDAVLVLETLVEEELRVELELEVIAAEMLHVVLDHNLDGLTCRSDYFIRLLWLWLFSHNVSETLPEKASK